MDHYWFLLIYSSIGTGYYLGLSLKSTETFKNIKLIHFLKGLLLGFVLWPIGIILQIWLVRNKDKYEFSNYKGKITQREYYNLKILEKLKTYIKRQPDQRFGQIIRNTGIVDTEITDCGVYFTNIFHEEPEYTLDKVNKFVK